MYPILPSNSPGSLSVESWPARCKCPGPTSVRPAGLAWSPDLWRWAWPSLFPSWMLASCRWSPSGRIWGACGLRGEGRCSWPPHGCSSLPTGHSRGRKTWAAKCEGSDSSSGEECKKSVEARLNIGGNWFEGFDWDLFGKSPVLIQISNPI